MENFSRLSVQKDVIVDDSGQIIVLHGVSLHDPYQLQKEEKQDPFAIVKQLASMGCRVVRLPILPGHYEIVKNYLRDYIDPLVEACKKERLYCILDWHAIGNPLANETRLIEQFHDSQGRKIYFYNVDLVLCKSAWRTIAERYGKEQHVIFEIFNEPAPGDKAKPESGLSPLPWKSWREEAEKIVAIIREHSLNIVLVSPTRWAYDLKSVAEMPLLPSNIAYSVHPYPIRKDWESMLSIAKGKFPLLITEWGFKEETKQAFMRGSASDYGTPLMDYCKKNSIGWVAWCYSTAWGPKMLASWKPGDYTRWGEFVAEHLISDI